MGARSAPVRLNIPHRLVYSAHEYPATVHGQPWFGDPAYPGNLPAVWDKYWDCLVKENLAPVLVGEFGTRYEFEKFSSRSRATTRIGLPSLKSALEICYTPPGHTPVTCPGRTTPGCAGGARELRIFTLREAQLVTGGMISLRN